MGWLRTSGLFNKKAEYSSQQATARNQMTDRYTLWVAVFSLVIAIFTLIVTMAAIFHDQIARRYITDITGEWSTGRLQKIVSNELKRFNWAEEESVCGGEECTPVHRFVGEYILPPHEDQRDSMAIVIVTDAEFCETSPCPSKLSFFQLKDTGFGWHLASSEIAFTEAYLGEDSTIEFMPIAPKKSGMFIYDSYSKHGYSHDSLAVHTSIGGKFKNIFIPSDVHFNNTGAGKNTAVDYTHELFEKKYGYYDIVVTVKGHEEEKVIDGEIYYRFTGNGYVEFKRTGVLLSPEPEEDSYQ